MADTEIIPISKALLLCDQILVEAVTGRTSLIGILDRVDVDQFPAEFPRCQVFLQFTNAFGVYNITWEIHDLLDNSIVAQIGAVTAEINDRLARVNIIMRVPRIEIPHPGEFDIVVLANGREVERQSLEFSDDEEPGEEWE